MTSNAVTFQALLSFNAYAATVVCALVFFFVLLFAQNAMRKIICYFYFEQRCGRSRRRRVLFARSSNWN